MTNMICGDPITKIWIANVLFKYDYKMQKMENMVVPVGRDTQRERVKCCYLGLWFGSLEVIIKIL